MFCINKSIAHLHLHLLYLQCGRGCCSRCRIGSGTGSSRSACSRPWTKHTGSDSLGKLGRGRGEMREGRGPCLLLRTWDHSLDQTLK